jgi:archaellum component FlaC
LENSGWKGIERKRAFMPFTVQDFHDLVRILEDKPEWRAELRRLVLTDELLALPEEVARLAQAQRRTEEQVAELAAALRALTDEVRGVKTDVGGMKEDIAGLKTDVKRLDGSVEELKTDVGGMKEDIAGLKTDVKRLDGSVEELKADMGTMKADMGTMKADMGTMKADMGTMKADMETMKADIKRLDVSVGELKGDSLELLYRQRAGSYFSRLVRRMRTLSSDELSTLLDDAIDRGQLSAAEKDEIVLTDLVVRGRRRDDDAVVYLVVEISWSIDPHDVERAVHRAALMSKVGVPALPVVAGKTVTDAAASLAQTLQVWQVTDGKTVPPEPGAASA